MDSPTARLPGYTDKQAEERALKLWSDWDVIRHYNRTENLLKEAGKIYLARVTKTKRDDDMLMRTETVIEPLRGIKGKMPSGPQTLVGFIPSSCGAANGDGDGVYTKEGELIVVFEGVSKQRQRPNGIDSVRIMDVRNIELLDEVQTWLNALPGYKPYD